MCEPELDHPDSEKQTCYVPVGDVEADQLGTSIPLTTFTSHRICWVFRAQHNFLSVIPAFECLLKDRHYISNTRVLDGFKNVIVKRTLI